MSSGIAQRVERHWAIWGVWLGLFLLVGGFFALRALAILLPQPTERALVGLLRGNRVLTNVGLFVFPTAVLLFGAAAAAMRHRDYARWISMAIGAAAATIALVLTMLAALGVIALMVT
jgi:hypothetical protein